MSYITKVADIPDKSFFAVLEETSVTIPGDERSRTNPGHGYPEHTSHSWNLVTFATEEEWKRDIERRALNKHGYPYKAVKISPASVAVTTQVSIQ